RVNSKRPLRCITEITQDSTRPGEGIHKEQHPPGLCSRGIPISDQDIAIRRYCPPSRPAAERPLGGVTEVTRENACAACAWDTKQRAPTACATTLVDDQNEPNRMHDH